MIKKILPVVALVLVVVAALWIVPVVIHARIEREIQNFFKDAKVSVGRLSIERPLALAVSSIRVEAEGYQVTVQKVFLYPHLNLTLAEPEIKIKKVPAEWRLPAGTTGAERSAIRLDKIRLQELVIEFKLPNLTGEIKGSAEIDIRSSQVRSANLQSPFLKSGGFKAEKIFFDLPGDGTGLVTADQLTVGKLKAAGIKGDIIWEGTTLIIRPIVAQWIRGNAIGRAQFLTRDPFSYEAELEIRDMDLGAFTEEMKLTNKMTIDGKVAGRVTVNGNISGVSFLKGSFASDEGGGNLVIQDPNWLKYLAQNTRQSLGLVEVAFREYHFDTAAVSMGASGRDLKFAVRMNGAKGRRDFEVNLHDQL